jgi:hypothetical protein
LCATKYATTNEWWSFVHCQNYYGRDEIGLPEIALKCASIAGIDWEHGEVGKCAGVDGSGKGAEGVSLLQESVKVSKDLGIKYVLQSADVSLVDTFDDLQKNKCAFMTMEYGNSARYACGIP